MFEIRQNKHSVFVCDVCDGLSMVGPSTGRKTNPLSSLLYCLFNCKEMETKCCSMFGTYHLSLSLSDIEDWVCQSMYSSIPCQAISFMDF